MWFGKRIRPSGLFPAAQTVLEQRWYFSELLVDRRRSVDNPLGLVLSMGKQASSHQEDVSPAPQVVRWHGPSEFS